MKTILLIPLLLLSIASVQMAQADNLTTYKINAVFSEPMIPTTATFSGSFTFNSATKEITNLTGTLSQAMMGPPQSQLALSYQNTPSVSDGKGGVIATVFAVKDATNVFSQGGYDWTKGQQTYGNNNSYVTINVNATNPTLGATHVNLLSYADCTPNGLMGTWCMSGHTLGGSMNGYPLYETITLADCSASPPSPGLGLNGSSLIISLSACAGLGQNADWWVVMASPWGEWFSYVHPNQWVDLWNDVGTPIDQALSGVSPAYQGPLSDLSGLALLDTTGLPSGNYVFYFGVDTDMNEKFDSNLLSYNKFTLNVP